MSKKREKVRILFNRLNKIAIEKAKIEDEFHPLAEELYGFYYADRDLDPIIDCLNYGLGVMTFREFDLLMTEESKKNGN